MISALGKHKIQPEHLFLLALIYVRQSSLGQVRRNTASTARQYDLRQRARDLGWALEQIVVIDEDQGRSGASADNREGFQRLIADVGLGRVGAVLSLEASRLARSCSDWYRLIEICALTHTLVIDEEGVYDPALYNDRLLLGFKGTMSEAELHWLKDRLVGGRLAKAQEGHLHVSLPIGLVYDPAGQVVLDPDEQVQQAVRLIFDLFDELGSAGAVNKHFARHELLFPIRQQGGEQNGKVIWKPLYCSMVRSILHNPRYAGAFVYGRTRTYVETLPGLSLRTRQRAVGRDDWRVLIQDAHPGYITWEQFQRNQQRLEDNNSDHHQEHRGAVREGSALLQGISLCGRCGRRMRVCYVKRSAVPTYVCSWARRQLGGKGCQTVRGDGIDAAITQALLDAIQPAQLEISLASLERVQERTRQIDRQWQLRIERAQYEADLASRRFYAVDPENRLVARTLEREWNEKLAEVQRLECEYADLPRPTVDLVSPGERQRILALAQDLPRIWHASTTTHAERKQLLRFLIKEVTLLRQEELIHLAIRWQTDSVTELSIPRPKQPYEITRTSRDIIERIRELAPTHTNSEIADILNRDGRTTGTGRDFTRKSVYQLRYVNKILVGSRENATASDPPGEQRGDGRYSTRDAAKLLNTSPATVARWCRLGKLEAVQSVQFGPYRVWLTEEIIARLRKPPQSK